MFIARSYSASQKYQQVVCINFFKGSIKVFACLTYSLAIQNHGAPHVKYCA